MNFRKFVSSLSLVLILYSIVELAFANANTKTRKPSGKNHQAPTTSSNGNALMKKTIEEIPVEAQQALEEIKVISSILDKKTSINRNLIIGTAVTNIALLLILSGLMGYSQRKVDQDDEEGEDKPGKKKNDKGEPCKETDDSQ